MLVFPAELGAGGIRAFRDWTETLPEEVTSIVRFLRPPPRPHIPEEIRGRPLLTMAAACIGPETEGEERIATLREVGEPILDTFAQIPAERLCTIHMDPEQPIPGLGHHTLIGQLSDDAIDSLVEVADPGAGSPLLLVMLRHGGGALRRAPDGAGALAKIDAAFALNAYGVPTSPSWVKPSCGTSTTCGTRWSPGLRRAGFSTWSSDPPGSRKSFRRRPASASPKSSVAGIPTG
jgi:hypothetical protein